jgi:hypothetical protein
VTAAPLHAYAAGRAPRSGLFIGFAGFDDASIEDGIRRLAAAVQPDGDAAMRAINRARAAAR